MMSLHNVFICWIFSSARVLSLSSRFESNVSFKKGKIVPMLKAKNQWFFLPPRFFGDHYMRIRLKISICLIVFDWSPQFEQVEFWTSYVHQNLTFFLAFSKFFSQIALLFSIFRATCAWYLCFATQLNAMTRSRQNVDVR